jgi:nucleotide-binding universal stress UspA family protein
VTAHPDRAWRCPPRVLVAAVDFETASARAVALAGFIASAADATLRVVHAERVEAPPYFTLDQIARLASERAAATADVAFELERFTLDAMAWPAEISVTEGAPVDVILQAAETADLLVLGSHGRRGPSRWWLGSVAERVVRGSRVPVLVTRADTSPLADVFARVVLVGDGVEPDAGARDCLQRFVRAMGGAVVQTGILASCRPDAMAAASLVVVAAAPGPSAWGLTHTVADALGRCERPALFLPFR